MFVPSLSIGFMQSVMQPAHSRGDWMFLGMQDVYSFSNLIKILPKFALKNLLGDAVPASLAPTPLNSFQKCHKIGVVIIAVRLCRFLVIWWNVFRYGTFMIEFQFFRDFIWPQCRRQSFRRRGEGPNLKVRGPKFFLLILAMKKHAVHKCIYKHNK